ncbi:MAG: OmpA family protein, partial [Bacteroidota bacterium]
AGGSESRPYYSFFIKEKKMTKSRYISMGLATLLVTAIGCTHDPKPNVPSNDRDTATLVYDSLHPDPAHTATTTTTVTTTPGTSATVTTTTSIKADPKVDAILTEMKARREPNGITIGIPETVLFKSGDAQLLPGARATLEKIRDVAVHYGTAPIAVNGYTDNQGKPEDNLALSEKRAMAVKDYLVNTLKASGATLSARGYGEASPVAPNTTPEGRQQNRRVEVFIQAAG